MNYFNHFYFDGFLRELGEATEDKDGQSDRIVLKKLEHRLIRALEGEWKSLFIHFVDAARRQTLRDEGRAYMLGFLMGAKMGGVCESQQKEE